MKKGNTVHGERIPDNGYFEFEDAVFAEVPLDGGSVGFDDLLTRVPAAENPLKARRLRIALTDLARVGLVHFDETSNTVSRTASNE